MRLSYLDSRSCCLPNLHPACIGLQQQNQQRTPQSVQPDWTELQSDTPSTRNCRLCWAPNITGSVKNTLTFQGLEAQFRDATGCFSLTGTGYVVDDEHGISQSGESTLNMSAGNSSSIYGASSTVQPSALHLLPCIKI